MVGKRGKVITLEQNCCETIVSSEEPKILRAVNGDR
jgi:hypothetical protein